MTPTMVGAVVGDAVGDPVGGAVVGNAAVGGSVSPTMVGAGVPVTARQMGCFEALVPPMGLGLK